MPLLIDQLIYTSFPEVGLSTLASIHVSPEIQEAFIQQVVYQYWDSYNPPRSGYRAAYLYQVTLEQNLFGWLYNDGQDDFGRSQIPYFQCYYYSGRLHADLLEDILTCLHRGPITLIDRQFPCALKTLVVPNLRSYQTVGIGVAISLGVRERSHVALEQDRLVNLFVAVDGEKVVELERHNQQKAYQLPITFTPIPDPLLFKQEDTLVLQNKLLESKTGLHPGDPCVPIFLNKFAMLIYIASGVISVVLILNNYYFLRLPVPAAKVQEPPVSIPNTNTNLGSITLASTLTGHSDAIWGVALSPNGQTLVSGSADKTIKVWNLDTGQLRRTLLGHSNIVRSVIFRPNGQVLVSGSGDKTIKLWNVQTGELIRTLTGHSGPVWSVAISHDGQTIVSGSEDKTIKIWNLSTGKLIRTLTGHSSRVFSIALSLDGQILISGSKDKTIKIWNLSTGKLIRTLTGHSDAVRSIALSPDERKFASSSWDKTIKIWNLSTGEQLNTFRGHSDRVVDIAFSADGQMLISTSVDKTVKIWSLPRRKLLRTLIGHSDWVLSVTISPSGQTVVSSSKDKTIKIWKR